jgi:Multidrug resistance efflux pump
VALLGAWVAWFFLARVTLYEVTDTARLENVVYPVESSILGRVVATQLVLGQEVQASDVLVELDAKAQRLQLKEEQVQLATLPAQLNALRDEIKLEEQALREERQATRLALDEARARYREAEATMRFAEEEAKRLTRLHASGVVAELDLLRARAEVQKRLAAANTLHFAVGRLDWDQRTKESERKTRLEQLKREITQLEGQIATAAVTIKRLEYEIEQHLIRAPMTGRLEEIANVEIGAVVSKGDKIGAVVPQGKLKAIAYFLPQAALGRIRPGQHARLRLYGFPWTQYGSISATVMGVASEARDGRVRVELTIHPNPVSPIPFQHGLPGTVEVEVDHVSPATLVLRVAGRHLSVRRSELTPRDDREAER